MGSVYKRLCSAITVYCFTVERTYLHISISPKVFFFLPRNYFTERYCSIKYCLRSCLLVFYVVFMGFCWLVRWTIMKEALVLVCVVSVCAAKTWKTPQWPTKGQGPHSAIFKLNLVYGSTGTTGQLLCGQWFLFLLLLLLLLTACCKNIIYNLLKSHMIQIKDKPFSHLYIIYSKRDYFLLWISGTFETIFIHVSFVQWWLSG